MEIPQPQSEPMICPRCGEAARFCIPYQMFFLSADGVVQFEEAMRRQPHRLELERLTDRQIVWYFPDLYGGPWQGWEGRLGVCICPSCGLRRKHDRSAKRHTEPARRASPSTPLHSSKT